MSEKIGWVIEYPYNTGVAYISWAMGYNRTRVLHEAMLFDNEDDRDKELARARKVHEGAKAVHVRRTERATRRIKE